MKKIILLILLCSVVFAVGCERQSNKVSYNLSLQADNFNIARRLTVISLVTNDVLFQMEGLLSIETYSTGTRGTGSGMKRLEIICKDGAIYKKHFVLLGDNNTVVIEDLGIGSNAVNNYKYVINYNPKMWIPVTVETVD